MTHAAVAAVSTTIESRFMETLFHILSSPATCRFERRWPWLAAIRSEQHGSPCGFLCQSRSGPAKSRPIFPFTTKLELLTNRKTTSALGLTVLLTLRVSPAPGERRRYPSPLPVMDIEVVLNDPPVSDLKVPSVRLAVADRGHDPCWFARFEDDHHCIGARPLKYGSTKSSRRPFGASTTGMFRFSDQRA
jgi:hypothetical protein